MTRVLYPGIIATLLAFTASSAFAQGGGREKRRKKVPRPGKRIQVDSIKPSSGPAKTVVTLRGQGLDKVDKVVFGPAAATPTVTRRRMLQVTLPDFKKSGERRVVLHAGKRQIDVGAFMVTIEGEAAPPPRPTRPPVPTQPDDSVTRPRPDVRPGRRPRRPRGRDYYRRVTTVSGYSPTYGAPGTKVVIRGRNFTPDTELLFGGQPVQPDKVTPRKIVFKAPRGSRDGMIKLRVKDRARPILVGAFDVQRKWDPREVKKRRDEQRKRAEARWQERRAKQAKKAAERRQRLAERQRELRESRAERRRQRQKRMRTKWKQALLRDSEVRAELALHAEREARLRRMLRLAEVDDRGKLVIRIEVALERENQRHENRMKALKDAILK